MVKAILFDFDGTIADSKGASFKSFVRTFDDFESFVDKSQLMEDLGMELLVLFKKMGVNPGHVDAMKRRYFKHYSSHVDKKGVKPCVSLKPLEAIKKDKYKLFIISNSETPVIRKTLKKMGAYELFSGVYGSEKFSTKDDMIRTVAKKVKAQMDEIVYVGDRFTDIEYSRKAGCISVAISNKCSWSDPETLIEQDPDYIIKDFRGLRKVLKGIKKSSKMI